MSTEAAINAARDAYLAWQSEIGTEEVVLVTPWVRRAAVQPVQTAPTTRERIEARDESVHRNEPHTAFTPHPRESTFTPGLSPAAGSDFFGAIADQLAKAERASAFGSRRTASTPAAQTPNTTTPAWLTAFLEAKDLDGYWRTLATEYPRWFPGTNVVAQSVGHAAPRLAVVELMPSPEGVFAGDSGALLDRMMIAIGVTRDQLYLTSLMKSAPATSKTWARKDTARMVPVLMRELQLAQCGLVLVMGEACAQVLLKTGRSIPDLLKSPVETDGLSLSATWHPAEIRQGDAAAAKPATTVAGSDAKPARPRATQAWDHLQWLRGLLPAR